MSAPDLTPREAVERWLDRQRVDKRDATVSAYWYRLKHFVEWCEDAEIDSLRDLDGWAVESYETTRRERGLAPITLQKELLTLKQFFTYAARVGLATDGLPETVEPPPVDPHDQTDDTRLASDVAEALLRSYRAGGEGAYRREHVFLDLVWYTCARMGAIRGLDVADIDLDGGRVHYRHRPESATPLKNGRDGERPVLVPGEVTECLERYLTVHREDRVDDYGRRPLFTTQYGRISTTSLRNVMYFATVPCRAMECPHGRERPSCEWYGGRAASGCPSSRSPHQVRTGSITWHRSRGVPDETIATKANASPDVIRRFYDKPGADDLVSRQDTHLGKLNFNDDTDTDRAE